MSFEDIMFKEDYRGWAQTTHACRIDDLLEGQCFHRDWRGSGDSDVTKSLYVRLPEHYKLYSRASSTSERLLPAGNLKTGKMVLVGKGATLHPSRHRDLKPGEFFCFMHSRISELEN